MATSTTGRDTDRIVGALVPATGAPLLFELQRSQRGRAAEVALTPIGDPAGAFRQRIRLTGVSEPAILDGLVQDLDNGPIAFEVTADGQRREATLAAVEPGATRLTIADLATLTIIFEDDNDEPTTSGIAGVDDFAIFVIFAIVVTVAAVGGVIVIVSSGEGDCDVEGEGETPQHNPGTGTLP